MNYDKLMAKARQTNAKRDETDRQDGYAAPSDAGVLALLRTVRSAIECGITAGDWNPIAEGQAMLENAIGQLELDPKLTQEAFAPGMIHNPTEAELKNLADVIARNLEGGY